MIPLPIRTPGLIALTALVFSSAFGDLDSSFAAVLNVPADFETIQEAIDAATHGDEIVVAPGRYVENLQMLGKNINLHSVDPTDWEVVNATILDGGRLFNVITFAGVEDETCRVAGFRITSGGMGGVTKEQGSGIWGAGTTALIEYNHITGNVNRNTLKAVQGSTLAWKGGGSDRATASFGITSLISTSRMSVAGSTTATDSLKTMSSLVIASGRSLS